MRYLAICLLIAGVAHAKVVHIRIPVSGSQEGSYWRDQYTIDENLSVWRLKDAVFHDFKLDDTVYVLAEKTAQGYKSLDPEVKLGDFGAEPSSPVLLFAVPRSMLKKSEEQKD